MEVETQELKMSKKQVDNIPAKWFSIRISETFKNISLTGKKLKKKECEIPCIIFGDHTKILKFVNFNFVAGADGVKVMRPFKIFNPKLFFYFLNAIQLPDKGYARHFQYLVKATIPLPPLPEQHKIVERIEELFTKLDAGLEALKKVKEQIKQYRQSVLKSAFEGRLTKEWREKHKDKLEPASALLNKLEEVEVRRNVPKVTVMSDGNQKGSIPEMWDLVSVAKSLRKGILEDVKDGNHGSNHPKKNEFSSEGLPFITSNLVEGFKVDYRAAPKIKGKPLERIKVGFSYPGDVILTHKGSVGRVGICEEDCVLTPQTTYYRCNKNIIKNRYLAYVLASPLVQIQLSRVKSQTTRDFVSISKQYYLFFPFCLLPEQQKIVEEIEKRFSIADEVEKTVDKSLEQAEKLRQSILKKAFEGKLTEKWREQNPELISGENSAEKLLEKIKAEKVKIEAEMKKRKKKRK
jgi:type I restriction enzyme S subunit